MTFHSPSLGLPILFALTTGCIIVDDSDGTRDLYDGCVSDAQCFDSACRDITVDYDDGRVTDAMCTYGCDRDTDCDDGGLCLVISNEPPLCYRPCFDDADCPSGFACVADEFGNDPVCLPW